MKQSLHKFVLTLSVVENEVCAFLLFLVVGGEKGSVLNVIFPFTREVPNDACDHEKGF